MVTQKVLEGASLKISAISKDFSAAEDPSKRIVALDSISLVLAPGELVSLIGPSGCGKSTLLRLIAGLEQPLSGDLLVDNTPITGPSAERGLVFQDPTLFPWLTVRGNIESGLIARGIFHRKRHEVQEFMRLVGLESFAKAYPHHLSGGMAQRVALARALINHPKILLLDEPLGALDAFTRMRMQDEVLRLWRARGTTILLVTHDIDEAIYMSDRIVIMSPRPGRVERAIDIALERPRQRNSSEFLKFRADILEHLHLAGQTLPDTAPDRRLAASPASLSGGAAPPAEIETPAPGASAGAGRTELDADVVIIGGGPAGSTLGAMLGRAGINHLILDQAVHPRPHVGESLVCSTTRIFQEIGFLEVMEREKFVHKHGAVWTHWAEGAEHVIRFREIPELGLTQDYTYHVDRSRFDQLLLRHAATQGSKVLEGARVEGVDFSDGGVHTVRARWKDALSRIRCRLVVDASGRSTILGSQLKLKRNDSLFDHFAVHNWFEGVERGPGETADFIHIHVLAMPRAWVWSIPINEHVTSVGIVTRCAEFPKNGRNVEAFFQEAMANHPLLRDRMAKARPLHHYVREGNYSYVMERFAGDGWLLVGDAARFVDPVFSSGVSVAMESAQRAATAIITAIRKNDFRAASFAEYERTVRSGVEIWREFILLYYALPPLFLDLLSQPESRLQLTRLLQGDVYDRASVPILAQMREAVRSVARTPAHPWRAQLSEELAERI